MIRWTVLVWHLGLEWLNDRLALFHYAEVRRHREAGDRAMERGETHGQRADRAREWQPRLWERNGDARPETEERRP